MMEYAKLCALAADTAAALDELSYSPALAFFAAGEEGSAGVRGGEIVAACVVIEAGESPALIVDGEQTPLTDCAVLRLRLAAGVHSFKLDVARGMLLIAGGRRTWK